MRSKLNIVGIVLLSFLVASCGEELSGDLLVSFSGTDQPAIIFDVNSDTACNNGALKLELNNETDEALTITAVSIEEVVVSEDSDLRDSDERLSSIFTITADDSLGTEFPYKLDADGAQGELAVVICSPWSAWQAYDVDGDGASMAEEDESAYVKVKLQLEGYWVDSKQSLTDSGMGVAYLTMTVQSS